MHPAIRVENIGKRYRLRHADHGRSYNTLRERLTGMAAAPFRGRASRRTEDFWALKDVNLTVQPGEVVGIIGRNGAGKSTLLKILSRIAKPTEGRITLRGRVGSLLEVGTGFHPELSGRENIYLNGSILGMTRREIRREFDAIVDFSGVERFLDTPVKRYSSGMYVRLAFAVAAHLRPEILLVDEVLAVGDAEFQAKCMGKMTEVAEAGRTVLFVSHNMAAVQALCGRIILVRGGTVHADGPAAEVIPDYLNDACSSDGGVFDLRQHSARSPSHRPIVRSLALQPQAAGEQIFPDDDLVVDVNMHSQATLREPRVALAIEDAFGRRIFTVASYFMSPGVPDFRGDATVRCTIPRLGLAEGRYLMSVSVADKYSGLLDSVDCCAWFNVGWRNNYANGEKYLPVYGPVLKESSWQQVATAAPSGLLLQEIAR